MLQPNLTVVEGPASSLPQNVEAEAALLGALMIDNRLAEDVQLKLRPEHFYEPLHGRIYEQILRDQPSAAGDERILYQLARAYEASGQLEKSLATLETFIRRYPDSPQAQEARFRTAEVLFALQRYREAETFYVLHYRFGEKSPYYEPALYKLGWCHYKQSQYPEALANFYRVLERYPDTYSAASSALAALGSTPSSVRFTGSHSRKPKLARPQARPHINRPQVIGAWRPRSSWRVPTTGCGSSIRGAPGCWASSTSIASAALPENLRSTARAWWPSPAFDRKRGDSGMKR